MTAQDLDPELHNSSRRYIFSRTHDRIKFVKLFEKDTAK